jgi:hypothetical protein
MLVVARLFHGIEGIGVTLLLHGCVMARFDGDGHRRANADYENKNDAVENLFVHGFM